MAKISNELELREKIDRAIWGYEVGKVNGLTRDTVVEEIISLIKEYLEE